jgi:hypothetical protein
MTTSADDGIVVTDRPASRYSRLYHWVLDHLAKFPGRVTIVTFVAGVVVTVAVVLLGGDDSPTTVVGLVATLWALFFGVMIYLLTARDTDTVLEQIADLHEQLATALASPDGDGEGDEAEPESPASAPEPSVPAEPAEPVPAEPVPAEPAPAEPSRPGHAHPPASRDDRDRSRPSAGHPVRPGVRILTGPAEVAGGMPAELLAAWTSGTGRTSADLARAWTRDPRSDRQWVVEGTDGERWVVFTRGAQGAGVISLSDPPRSGRTRRPSGRTRTR